MRDRLIEIIKSYSVASTSLELGWEQFRGLVYSGFADHLLSNGVIVPPCKVGDTVWYELYGKVEPAVVYSCTGVLKKQGIEITDANAKSSDGLEVAFNGKCIGKTVFLTKEEAERALK